MGRVFQSSGAVITQYYGNGGHGGTDCVPDSGGIDMVVAHSEGTVVWAQSGYGNWKKSTGDASYGNAVKLRHANGYSTLYAHMEYISVGSGQHVGRGQVLGRMGDTGNSYGAHLHFEVRDPGDDRVDSGPYLTSDLPGLAGGGSSTGSGHTGTAAAEPEKKESTQVTVKSVEGTAGLRAEDHLGEVKTREDGVELLIQHGKTVQAPVLEGDVTLEWKRKGSPGSLQFHCLKSEGLSFQEGDPVSLRVGGKDVFYGYVFKKSRQDPVKITVTCYDQLRYFKNKDTIVYENKKYSDLVKMLAKDYGLKTGVIEDTEYVIESRIEEATLFDMCGNASDLTVVDTGKLFVLYDDFGKLCLRNIENMKLDRLIDRDTAQKFSYESSIDKDVYSRIRLAMDNDQTGERELYDTNSEWLQQQWGILQLYEKSTDGDAALLKERGKLMLDYYGKKRRTLSINKCLGDIRVRGGSSLVVMLELGDMELKNYMVVESVKHTFSQGEHWMDLDVTGWRGEFFA